MTLKKRIDTLARPGGIVKLTLPNLGEAIAIITELEQRLKTAQDSLEWLEMQAVPQGDWQWIPTTEFGLAMESGFSACDMTKELAK